MFQISFISLYFRTQAFRLARKIRKSLKLNLPELCKMFEYIFFLYLHRLRPYTPDQTKLTLCSREISTYAVSSLHEASKNIDNFISKISSTIFWIQFIILNISPWKKLSYTKIRTPDSGSTRLMSYHYYTHQLIPESEICIATATTDSSYVKFILADILNLYQLFSQWNIYFTVKYLI